MTLLPPSALIVHECNILSANGIKELIEGAGYGAEVIESRPLLKKGSPPVAPSTFKVVFSIEGMTCSSCTCSVNRAMENLAGVTSPSVDLIGNSGSVVVPRREDAEKVRSEIEDAGFGCTIVEIIEQSSSQSLDKPGKPERTVILNIEGMTSE